MKQSTIKTAAAISQGMSCGVSLLAGKRDAVALLSVAEYVKANPGSWRDNLLRVQKPDGELFVLCPADIIYSDRHELIEMAKWKVIEKLEKVHA